MTEKIVQADAQVETAGSRLLSRNPLSGAARSAPELAARLKSLVAIRLVAITSALLPFGLFLLGTQEIPRDTGFLLAWAGSAYLVSLIYLACMAADWPAPRFQGNLQFLGDVALITALVVRFGTTSPFSTLYLLVITVASVLLGRRTGITVATMSWLAYLTVLVGDTFSWRLDAVSVSPVFDGHLVYNAVIHLAGFYAVAVLTSNLSQRASQVELALREKRKDLANLRVAHRDVVESIPSGLLSTDLDGRITSANRAAEEMLDTQIADLLDHPISTVGLFSADEWEELTGRARLGERIREDTEYIGGPAAAHIGYTVNPLTRLDRSVSGFILIFQDLTEWRQLQEEVRLKDRMAAIGELASGLAHEIGNPLAAISGSVQMLSSSVPTESPHYRLLEIILKESQRLDRTIKGFLQFARPKARSSVRFDVGALLTENVELLMNSSELERGHRINLDLDIDRVMLVADPDQISQIFWNLARNALKAMADGGMLQVTGRVQDNKYILSFIDTGRGMTEEERANLFHPFRSFFDTGTGIGMAIVYRIVEEHGGRLNVESRPGAGTVISVEIPGIQSSSRKLAAQAQ